MKILIVDDEKLLRWSLSKTLDKAGYAVVEAGTIAEGRTRILEDEPEICLLDVNLPDGNGMELLQWARNTFPHMMFVMITARGRVQDAVEAMRLGAHDYFEKPLQMEPLVAHMNRIREVIELKRELWRLGKTDQTDRARIVASSKAMEEVLRLAHTVAESGAQAILLLGESGSGKDHLARYIHEHSSRRDQPFMVINCAALPDTLLESELFGYEKGAFTDAKTQKKGILELADNGTVFLDEIGEMKPAMQAKLLRVLEDWTFKRVGGARDIHVDVRVIAATNQDLQDMVRRRDFREDLFYRLNVFPIRLPSLRERPDDILPLARHFIQIYNRRFNKNVAGLAPEAAAGLLTYAWPGNVRELKNVVERIMILASGSLISAADLNFGRGQDAPAPAIPSDVPAMVPDGILPLGEAERLFIRRALEKAGGNVSQAAKLLQISRDKLRYKIKKHKLEFSEA
jgi:two-component system, NtrC family, response regulator AtoC